MQDLETLLARLCEAAAPLLVPGTLKRQKWVVWKGQPVLKDVLDQDWSRRTAYTPAQAKLPEMPEYLTLLDAMNADPVFGRGVQRCGSWGNPEQLLRRILLGCLRDVDSLPSFDISAAIADLQKFRSAIDGTMATFHAVVRVLGVRLSTECLQLGQHTTLCHLFDDDLTERQRFLDDRFPLDPTPLDMSEHTTEMRATFFVPLDSEAENPFAQADMKAFAIAERLFTDHVTAIRLTSPGTIGLGPLFISSLLSGGGITFVELYSQPLIWPRDMLERRPVLHKDDEPRITRWIEAIQSPPSDDPQFHAAIRRLMLSTQRYDSVDRLVDLVIAWEAILLTTGKEAIMLESSYRFSVNGAALLKACGITSDCRAAQQLMKSAYSVRSKIVHGASEAKIHKELAASGMSSPEEMCRVLENHLRTAITWLRDTPHHQRPHRAKGGWEELLWA